jgi:hypothetical protein
VASSLETDTDFRLLGCAVLPAVPQEEPGADPYQVWTLPGGRVWTLFHRVDQGYLVRFPGMADFRVPANAGAIECIPVEGIETEALTILFNNQVLPLVLAHRGHLVLHASCLSVDGEAVAFCAESGRGKSTLAAAFAGEGFPVLSDDGLRLDSVVEGVLAMPGSASLRLWSDSLSALRLHDAERAPSAGYTPKLRLLAGAQLPFAGEPQLLKHIYFLGEGEADQPVITPLSPCDALVQLIKHSFLLDPLQQDVLRLHFDKLMSLVRSGHCYRLDYPRDYAVLPQVIHAVRCHTGGDGNGRHRLVIGDTLKPAMDVVASEVGGETMLLHAGAGTYFNLGEIGTLVWRFVAGEKRLSVAAEALCTVYDVEPERASRDVLLLVQQLLEAGLVVRA